MDILTLAQLNKLKKSGGAGYTETTLKELLPPTEGILSDEEISSFVFLVKGNAAFEVGKTYTIVYNGERLTMAAREHPDAGMIAVGAASSEEMANSVYPVTAMTAYDPSNNQTNIIFLWMPIEVTPDGDMIYEKHESLTLAIYEETETIHPIDPKFIPPMDSLTINGTDGKRYKLTVNNGSISVAEVV